MKANEKAERSGTRRSRGSRGLRKNKRRARGYHPRRSPCRQPLPRHKPSDGPTNRHLRSLLRSRDWAKKVSDALANRIRVQHDQGYFLPPERKYSDSLRKMVWTKGSRWGGFRERWRRLHSCISTRLGKHVADVAISHTFNAFIEDLCQIRLDRKPVGSTNSSSFACLLDGISDLRRKEKDPSDAVAGFCTGSICRVCARKSRKGDPCPGKPIAGPKPIVLKSRKKVPLRANVKNHSK